jgi:hypothetical protein
MAAQMPGDNRHRKSVGRSAPSRRGRFCHVTRSLKAQWFDGVLRHPPARRIRPHRAARQQSYLRRKLVVVVHSDMRLDGDPILDIGEMAQRLLVAQCSGTIIGR